MPTLFVAKSDSQQKWASDVGLTRHLYKLGLSDGDAAGAVAALNAENHAGRSDWTLVASQDVEQADPQPFLARVARKETLVDPAYYPQLKCAEGIFKVKLANVENHFLVRDALEGQPTSQQAKKPKAPSAAQIGTYLLRMSIG
ncbi:MAG: hypothetical protein U1E38_07485 [Rhodospirillales bacterium]